MTRFIHLTDLHLSHPDAGDPDYRASSAQALEHVVGIINAMDPAPDFVVASGDLTNMGDAESYAMLRDLMAPLNPPLLMALGNHDKRSAFHQVLGNSGSDAPYCHDASIGGLHVITLDTLIAGHVAGEICEGQFAFLEHALARHGDLPKLIVMHHPPLIDETAMPWMSLDHGSTNRLLDMLRAHDVAGIACGHIHINRVSQWHGIPVIVSGGLDSNIDVLETTDLRIVAATGFGICDWQRSGITVSYVPVSPEPAEMAVIDHARLLTFN